jgi:hypothetical protein
VSTVQLDWKGWWLLRPEMTEAPELRATAAVYAIMGSKLRKVKNGVGSVGRELVLFGVHKGAESVGEHLGALRRTALGVFALQRCKEIGKHPIVYVAAMPDDTEDERMQAVLSALYSCVPFAPRHHAVPRPYRGKPFELVNAGKHPGLPEAYMAGVPAEDYTDASPDFTELDDDTLTGESVTARPTDRSTAELQQGMPTERIEKPPRLADTTRIDKDVEEKFGLVTEKVDKPDGFDDTEFVPPPGKAPGKKSGRGRKSG